jgi:hypothetical protein
MYNKAVEHPKRIKMKTRTLKHRIVVSFILFLTIFLIGALIVVMNQSLENHMAPKDNSVSNIWDQIKNRTWQWDTFAGGSWTFFERAEGKFVVIQTYGSGVPLIDSTIKRVDVTLDSIVVGKDVLVLQDSKLLSNNVILDKPDEIYLIDYQGNPLTLEIYLAVQSRTLDNY